MDERGRRGVAGRKPGRSEPGGKKSPRNSLMNSSRQKKMSMNNNRTARSGRTMKKSNRARRRRRTLILRCLLVLILIIAAIGGFIIWRKYGASDEKADLEQYYDIENKDEFGVVINNQVVKRDTESQDAASDSSESLAPGKMYDGQYYVEYSIVRKRINKRFYWDSNENLLLYTLPEGNVSVVPDSKEYTELGETKSEDYVILKTDGTNAYIAIPFLQMYTNLEYTAYEDPARVVITSDWGEIQTAKVKRNTQIRYQGGVKSPVLTDVKKSDKVTVLEDEDAWTKVASEDGMIGYIKTKALKDIGKETTSRDFNEPEYTSISKDYKINMVWHNVTNATANGAVLTNLKSTKGLTTIAPTWFSLADTEGNISSLADEDYVKQAHQSGLEVWAVLRDFHGGINSYDETYEVLSYTSKRQKVIDQVISKALASGVDGINLDFELVSSKCGVHYIQFVRELSAQCRQNQLVLSIDNYVPQPYNQHYDLEEQGAVADYVIIMGYDEHTDGSYEAGSVASISYLKDGVENALLSVSSDKLIAGVPFFTRLWKETPKTDEELAEEAGTEAANYPNKISSKALGMDEAVKTIKEAGATTQWDDTTKQNYAEWTSGSDTYKIWLEDTQSLEEKLKVIRQNDLAGVAEWSLGRESSSVWKLILQYIQ